MSFSSLVCGYILAAGTLWAVVWAFTKHDFRRLHWVVSCVTALCLLLFGGFLLAKVEYLPALRHLSYYQTLQDASDAKEISRETLLFLDGCAFHTQYQDDPNMIYSYRYTIGKGMRCAVKSTTDGFAYLDMRYPPRTGYITIP